MKRSRKGTSGTLFEECSGGPSTVPLGEGAVLLRGFAAKAGRELMEAISSVAEQSPFRHMVTPGGYKMSVAMTNSGPAGWVTDRGGYRYVSCDPLTSNPWPSMPSVFTDTATRAATAAGFPEFHPDACLINRYEPSARLSLHQDKDEADFNSPIVSISLGLPATFLWGGLHRSDPTRRILLESGDIVVWGGPSRLVFHGVAPLAEGHHLVTGGYRFNLTFRKAFPS
jgi:alkylated DNA repair protein (DNA oxidative demethylase)